MKLYEYQAKRLFQQYDIPIPQGLVTQEAHEVLAFAGQVAQPVILKAQVHVSGRSQQGGILTAATPEEAQRLAAVLFESVIADQPVKRVLVEQFIASHQRLFLALRYDRQARRPLLLAAIEQPRRVISSARPERLFSVPIHPLRGLLMYQVHEIASHMELPHDLWQPFVRTVMQLYHFFDACDAEYVELDPLVTTAEQTIVALNGRAVIDDNALARHPEMASLLADEPLSFPARLAHDSALPYVALAGQVGAIVNGSGAALALLDGLYDASAGAVQLGSFIDLQSRETHETLKQALRVMQAAQMQVIIVSLFSGRMNGVELARLLLGALDEARPQARLILRIEGVGAADAQRMLRQRQGVRIGATLTECAAIAHLLLKGRRDADSD